MSERKLNADEVCEVVRMAVEQGLSFQLNVHGLDSIETAIDLCEKMAGSSQAQINHQPSCFVVSAEAGKGDVAFFVSKNPFS